MNLDAPPWLVEFHAAAVLDRFSFFCFLSGFVVSAIFCVLRCCVCLCVCVFFFSGVLVCLRAFFFFFFLFVF